MSSWVHSTKLAGSGTAVALLLVGLTATVVQADTIYVCWDGSGDYLTIQEGIDAAEDGDEVVVCDGLYTGAGNKNLDFAGKAITVRSANGPENCLIDCEGDGRGFNFHSSEGPESVVEGFTIVNGYEDVGAGIRCSGGSPIIRDCAIRDCSVRVEGGGVFLGWGAATLEDCALTGNSTLGDTGGQSNGGGIYCVEGHPRILNCVISGNRGDDNGGGVFCNESDATISACTISDNSAPYNGGGVYCYRDSQPTIEDCTITLNEAADGGGVYCRGSTHPVISGCTIAGNVAQDQGGGVFCHEGCDASVSACRIADNSAGTHGGAVFCIASSPTWTSCELAANSAGASGGAFHCDSGSVHINSCALLRNVANGDGGGLSVTGGSATTVVNTTFRYNVAGQGGGLNVTGQSNATAANCIAWGDTASLGAEIALANDSTLEVTYSNVEGGEAAAYVGNGCTLTWGTGSLDTDPGFALPEDFYLFPESPSVDSGTNDPPGGLSPGDVHGHPRLVDGDGDELAVVDRGAHEYNDAVMLLAVSPLTAHFHAVEDGPNPDDQYLLIRNAGGGTLSWEVTEDCPWLVVDPPAGESTGEIDEVSVQVDIIGLPRGEYSCLLTITGDQAANSPRVVEAKLTINSTLRVPSEYETIQAAIDAAVDGDEVLVADGRYTGPGNTNLDYHGKAITVHSENGPERCVIDGEGGSRGFNLHSGEGPTAVVEGFTVVRTTLGAIVCRNSDPTIRNCILAGNTAQASGGAFYAEGSDATVSNCAIVGNTAAERGGGIYCKYSGVVFVNCSISGNSAHRGGAICCDQSSTPSLTNCVLWGDEAVEGAEIALGETAAPSMLTVSHCDVQGAAEAAFVEPGCELIWADGNLDADPLFAFASDVHLMAGSPCIDAGTDDPPGGLPDNDLDGNARALDGDGDGFAVVDMGAYEHDAGRPAIALATKLLEFTAFGDAGDTYHPIDLLRNCGGGTLQWQIAEECDWLEIIPSAGESDGEIDQVTLHVDPSVVDHGKHVCVVTVTDPEAANSPRILEVTLCLNVILRVPSEYATIQEAIDAALDGDLILVADGVYTGVGNRDLDFRGKLLTVRSENGPEQTMIYCEESGRGFHLVSGERQSAIIEGFTISGGAAAEGGGIYCINYQLQVRDCVIVGCRTGGSESHRGGGIYCEDGPLFIYDTEITANTAGGSGGGVYALRGDLFITDCTLETNIAEYGAGIYCDATNGRIGNCTIRYGTAAGNGGGIYLRSVTTFAIENCVVRENTASGDGGGIFCFEAAPTITSCSILGNSANSDGGGLRCKRSDATVAGCEVSGNSARDGGGVSCDDCDPLISDCAIVENVATIRGGGIALGDSDATVRSCTIRGNATSLGGYDARQGGGIWCSGGSPTILNCEIANNEAFDYGGGICCSGSSPAISGCAILENTAARGGAIYCYTSNAQVTNCTVTRNVAASGGGIYCLRSTSPTLANCIFWDDAAQTGPEIALTEKWYPSTLTVSYCDVEGGPDAAYVDEKCTLIWGDGNIDVEPLLTRDHKHIQAHSPCCETGNNALVPPDLSLDTDGEPRIDGEVVDMGCDEFIDTDLDELPDWWEQFYFGSPTGGDPQADNDGDGRINLDEYAFNSNPWQAPRNYYVSAEEGDDDWDGRAPHWDGEHGPKATIQAAIEATDRYEGDTVFLAAETYVGNGNRDLDLNGKVVTISSTDPDDPNVVATTVMNCRGTEDDPHRGFTLHSHEEADSVIAGITITKGYGPPADLRFGSGSSSAGGAVYCGRAAPTIRRCRLAENSAETGGAIYCDIQGDANIRHCTITENQAYAGGGICCYMSTPTIDGCALIGNRVSANSDGGGGAFFCDTCDGVVLADCIIHCNIVEGSHGGGIGGRFSNLTVSNCTITGNSATGEGGGVHGNGAGGTISNCLIAGNKSWRGGGSYGFNGLIASCTIIENEAECGGGLYSPSAVTGQISNCTFALNVAEDLGGALCFYRRAEWVLSNCILWNDFAGHGAEIAAVNDGGGPTLTITYCDVAGGEAGIYVDGMVNIDWGEGNMEADPLLADTGHLQSDSPCRDAGDPNGDYAEQLDIDQEPRLDGERVEIGSDEFYDLDADQLPDWWELKYFGSETAADPEGDPDDDGRSNLEEYIRGTDPLEPPRTFYVDPDGNDDWDGLVPEWDGHSGPKATFQAAIDVSERYGDEMIVAAPGIYAGPGNRDIDFKGKNITARSTDPNDPAVVAATVVDCEGSDTDMHQGFVFHRGEEHTSVLAGLSIMNGHQYSGGGIACFGSSPVIRNCVVRDISLGGGIYCENSSAIMENCGIIRNRDGGINANDASHLAIRSCLIAENYNDELGGGIRVIGGSAATVVNSTIVENASGYGAGGVLAYENSTITNSVLWDNLPDEVRGDPVMTYSDVRGGAPGMGNIDIDPQFAFPPADYHLPATSPCIDVGTNEPPGGLPPHDLDGTSRPLDGDSDGESVADMGAYEFDPETPRLAISQSVFTFYALADSDAPRPEHLRIRNTGGGTFTWDIIDPCDWLAFTPPNGETSTEVDEVTVSAESTSLPPGQYDCTAFVVAAGAADSPQALNVTLYVGTALHVPGQYPTIQAAVDAACPADVVFVADGVYTGPGNKNLDFRAKAITVRSENGPKNCIIDCEYDGRGFHFFSGEGPAAIVDGLTILNGYGVHGSGIYCVGSSPTIRNCQISGIPAGRSRGISLDESNARIVGCTISGNLSGGIGCARSGPLILGCAIVGNSVTNSSSGGGIRCSGLGNPVIHNCLIAGNYADLWGGGVYAVNDSSLAIDNCTVTHNTADYRGGGLYLANRPHALNNTIIWGNTAQQGTQAYLSGGTTVTFSYCDVDTSSSAVYVDWGAHVIWGPGIIESDPRLIDPDDGDYRLSPGSPCIDAGDNEAVPPDTLDFDGDGDTEEPIPFDLDGKPRFVDDPGTGDTGNADPDFPDLPIVDMGAYEFQVGCAGDIDGDGDTDHGDLGELLRAWGSQPGDPNWNENADLDGSGEVDHGDLGIFLADWECGT